MLQRKVLSKKKRTAKRKKQPVKRKKEETWLQVKQEIRPKFYEAGITFCELYHYQPFLDAVKKHSEKDWDACTGHLFPSFAHSLRRRKIARITDKIERARAFREVIRACTACHFELDSLPHNVTYVLVRQIIAERPQPII